MFWKQAWQKIKSGANWLGKKIVKGFQWVCIKLHITSPPASTTKTYMWKMFFEKIVDHEEYQQKFLKQMQEQKNHLDLEPLFQAYGEFIAWSTAEGIAGEDLDREWYKLGKKQKELLPAHMLKEFSRQKDTWRTDSTFDVDRMPKPKNCDIFHNIKSTYDGYYRIEIW